MGLMPNNSVTMSVALILLISIFYTPSAFCQTSIPPQLEFEENAPDYRSYRVSVKAGQGSSLTGHLDVPSSYRGLPVTVIGCLSSNITSVSIPNSIVKISDNGFGGSDYLESVVIPNSVREVGVYAFKMCPKLSSVVISPANSINGTAFSGCDIKKGAYPITMFPNRRPFVATIEVPYPDDCIPEPSGLVFNASKTAFYFAPWDIRNLELPATISLIGSKAFAGCTKLDMLVLNSIVPPDVSDDTFNDSDIKAIRVPAGCRSAYIQAAGWSRLASRIIEEVKTERVEIVTDISNIQIGQTVQLQAQVIPSNATFKDVEWAIADPRIATVNEFGLLEAKAVGSTEIIASVKETEVRNVFPIIVHPIYVERISVDPQRWTGLPDSTFMVNSSVFPENATDKSLKWSSTDETVATVDATGKVTTHKDGRCVINVEASDGSNVSAQCTVTVRPWEAESVTFDKTEWRGKVNQKFQITAVVLPDKAKDITLDWKSSKSSVATVDSNGVVTAVGVGNATITATAANGKSASCEVTVEAIPVERVSIDRESMGITGDCLELVKGKTMAIKSIIEPEDATVKTLLYESSCPTVAMVNPNGIISAVALGEAVITVMSKDGVSDRITVKVFPIPVESITVRPAEIHICVDETYVLEADLQPWYAGDQTVEWSSSDDRIATVDGNGVVKGVSLGTATITATTTNGLTATCQVIVEATLVKRVTIDLAALGIEDTFMEICQGETRTIKVNVEPSNATDKSLIYSSSYPDVVSVDENGNIKGLSPGYSKIEIKPLKPYYPDRVAAWLTVTVVSKEEESVTLNIAETKLKVAETVQLTANVLPENATDKTVSWSSSDDNVATVDENGLVKAVSLGMATVTVTTVNGLTSECKVTVVPTPVTDIVLDWEAMGITGNSVEMKAGEEKAIIANIQPADATDKDLEYESSEPEIVAVDDKGNIRALSIGKAVITIKAVSGVSTTLPVIVVPTSAESVRLNVPETVLKAGENVQLQATIFPEYTTDKTITWGSSDTGIATVDESGLVTGVSVGGTIVRATTVNGLIAECKVTVAETPVTGVAIDREALGMADDKLEIKIGETRLIPASVMPENATDRSLHYESSNPDVVSVDNDGKIVALSVGSAVLTVSSTNGLSDKTTVSVSAVESESVSLSLSESILRVGETTQLTATVLPFNATDKGVTWSSSDSSVVTVDNTGLVTAVSLGNAIITATTANGLTDQCKVTVEKTPVTGISFDKAALGITDSGELEMIVGETKTIIATVVPENATDKRLLYSSSSPKVVSIDENGNMTALSVGTALIYVRSDDSINPVYAYIHVKVTAIEVEDIVLNMTEVELKAGQTVQLNATVFPEDATNKNVIWSSSDISVATVDNNGFVTAYRVGASRIRASIYGVYYGPEAECLVNVVKTPAEKVVIDREALGISGNDLVINKNEWERKKITVTIKPEDTTDKYVRYETSDFYVAYVDGDGYISVNNTGYADITAIAMSGVSDKIRVWVIKDNGDKFDFKVNDINYNIDKNTKTASVGKNREYSGENLIIPDYIGYMYEDYPVTKIEQDAFNPLTGFSSRITGELRLPNSLTEIGDNAFSECSGLSGDLIIPNSVTTIGFCAFYHCSGFNGELNLPDKLIRIGANAFRDCSGLTGNLHISNSVTEIGSFAFCGCSGLTGNLYIPDSVTEIGSFAFSGCSGFTGGLHIPNSLSEIGSYTFSGCSGLTGELRIPDSVMKIGNDAFSGCSGFSGSLIIDSPITRIESRSFQDCSGLKGDLVVGNSVAQIDEYAFKGTCFKSVDLPSSLTRIDRESFNFKDVAEEMTFTCRAVTPPFIQSSSFLADQAANITLYVPVRSIESYKSKWCSQNNIRFKAIKGIEGEMPERIELSETEVSMEKNQTKQLVATVFPEGSYDRTVTWTSSDPSIASVDENGLVSAVSPGVAHIVATSVNGLTKECRVTVKDPAFSIIPDLFGDDNNEGLRIMLMPGGVRMDGVSRFNTVIDILDVNGVMIMHQTVDPGESFGEKIGTISLEKGIYLVKVLSKNRAVTKKVNIR